MSFSPIDGGTVFSYVRAGDPGPEKQRRDVRTYYLDTLILVLFQRLSLLNFSWELSETQRAIHDHKYISELRLQILDFANRCWFSQLTNSPYGQDIWKHWKMVMEVEELYKEVRGQLQELDDYISRVRQEKITLLGGLIASVSIPVSLVISFFGTNIQEVQGVSLKKVMIISVPVLSITVILIIMLFLINARNTGMVWPRTWRKTHVYGKLWELKRLGRRLRDVHLRNNHSGSGHAG